MKKDTPLAIVKALAKMPLWRYNNSVDAPVACAIDRARRYLRSRRAKQGMRGLHALGRAKKEPPCLKVKIETPSSST